MEKKYQGILYIGAFVISLCLGLLFLNVNSKGYHLLFFAISGLSFVKGVSFTWNNSSPDKSYDFQVRSLLSTYDSILVKVNSVPKIGNRSIVNVMSIDDLIDAQLEIRKPICYMKQSESCSFLLLDKNVVYIYAVKLNEQVQTPVEIEIEQLKAQKSSKKSMDLELFDDIDKTTIVKLSNLKSYKVSPVLEQTTQMEALDII